MDLETVIINGSFYKKVPKFYYKFNSNDLSISFDKKKAIVYIGFLKIRVRFLTSFVLCIQLLLKEHVR